MSDSDRLIRLEEQVTDLLRTVDELNEVITDQWKEIERVRREMARLTDQVADLESGSDFGKPSKPPHY